jgi:hypothetical protein
MITPSFGLTATERVLPRLALDFTTAVLDSRITFTRTTSASNPATYVASNGLVTAATNNQPRFDYNPTTLAIRGLLIEESRANLMLRSEDFASANWNKGGASVTSNSAVSPDGATTADTVIENTANATHTVDQAINVSASTSYTVTFFAKRASGTRNVFVQINTSGGTTGAGFVWFDLGTGVTSAITTLGGTFVGVSASATAFGSSWYRCTLTFTTNIGNTGATFYIGPYNAGRSYLGDGTSGVYLWGAQLEAGAFATSYIPTTTTALTRNADVATMTGTNFSSWYNASEGALTVWFDTNATGPGGVFSINNGSGAQRVDYRAGTASGYVFVNGNLAMYLGIPAKGILRKACVAIKNADFAGQVTGGTFRTATDAIPTGLSTLNIGSLDSATNFVNGHIANIFYYPQRLINAEVQAQVRI